VLDRKLFFVVTTARAGSFTAAAERVGVTQSAVTKGVADLERQLGYTIFNRTARGIILTEEGSIFVERAARIIDETQELLHGSRSRSDPYSGTLKIGVCPPSIDWLLVEPISLLNSRHPLVRLDIRVASFERVVQLLRAGTTDIAFGFEAAFAEQPDFRIDQMPAMRTTFFARKDHPIFDCPEMDVRELAKYPLVSPSESRPYDSFMRQIFEEAGVEPSTKLHFIDSFPIVSRLVSNSDAIGMVSVNYAESAVFKRRFARVPILETRPLEPLCVATRLRWSPRPVVRAFIKACHEKLTSS